MSGPTFARWVFRFAGVYGVLVLTPQYFLERQIAQDQPPPITHPEFYYGFIGVALAWQVAFLIIGQNPVQYRPLMIPAVLEKLAFGLAVAVLYLQSRVALPILLAAGFDLFLGALFVAAFMSTRLPKNPNIPSIGPTDSSPSHQPG